MLKEINDALAALGLPVFYGRAGTMDGEDLWDYIVFYRDSISPNATKKSLTDSFTVALVQENYVDDDKVSAIIKAMRSIPGVRFGNQGATFDYSPKPGTDTVLEACMLPFIKPSKVCANG